MHTSLVKPFYGVYFIHVYEALSIRTNNIDRTIAIVSQLNIVIVIAVLSPSSSSYV